MEAVLILLALEVHAAKLEDFPIIPPQKAADDEIGKVRNDDQAIEGILPDLGRRESHEPGLLVVSAIFQVKDREKDST